MNRIQKFWSDLRSNFWFVPSIIVLVSIALAAVLIGADSTASRRWLGQWPRLFGSGAEGARGMMSTIAGSMMTVVGVSFSMILMVLALASTQYTSRVLRNFMRSRETQVVLGIFAGIFTYSLIVLRSIRSGDEGAFVPSLAVFFGFVLALGGVGTLIFFIHHIASSIQASSIIASVAYETMAAMDRLFPEKLGQEPEVELDDSIIHPLGERSWHPILSARNGYILNVDTDALLSVARERKTIVRMERGIGQFTVQNTVLFSLAMEEPPNNKTIKALLAAFDISSHRTIEQDMEFGIRQIVDIAMRALSPGVNDTTTAVMCVDYLTAIMARLAPRPMPSLHRHEDGHLRVIAKGLSYDGLLAEAFDQIRSNSKGNVAVMRRMLGGLQTIAALTARPDRRRAISQQVRWIADLADRTLDYAQDRAEINTALEPVREMLKSDPIGEHENDMEVLPLIREWSDKRPAEPCTRDTGIEAMRRRAIDRWENEGGVILPPEPGEPRGGARVSDSVAARGYLTP